MKKILLVVLLLAIPMAMFAEDGFFLGATALYKGDPFTYFDVPVDPTTIVDNLAFGADMKIKLAIFEIQATALYNINQSFNCYLDVGLMFDIAILSVGVGVGPNFVVNFMSGAPEAFGFGFNGKAHVDLNLGIFKISAYYMILVDSLDLAYFTDALYLGNVGLSLMFKLM